MEKKFIIPFPLNDINNYNCLGAAHGLIGNLYLLLCAIKIYPALLTYEGKNISPLISTNFGNLHNLFLTNLNYIKSLQI